MVSSISIFVYLSEILGPIIYMGSFNFILKNHNIAWDNKDYSLIAKRLILI